MNLAHSFTDSRSHGNDPETSKAAAQNAASGKAANERICIRRALERVHPWGLTAKEIAQETGLDYFTVQRRISETSGIARTSDRREGCAVWTSF